MLTFKNRRLAGKKLGRLLVVYKDESPVVLARANDGIAVGAALAKALDASLDYALSQVVEDENGDATYGCAVTETGKVVFANESDRYYLYYPGFDEALETAKQELGELADIYKKEQRHVPLLGKTVIVVDDAILDPILVQAVLVEIAEHAPAQIVVGSPVMSPEAVVKLKPLCDDITTLTLAPSSTSVDAVYERYKHWTPEEVVAGARSIFAPLFQRRYGKT